MPYVQARDGEKIYVRTFGRGPACMLLHGFASDSTSWLPFVLPLAHRYRFYMPDLRGFGRSRHARLRHACPLTDFAEDLEDVLDHFALKDLPLGGISMGAFTAVQSFKLFGGRRFSRYMHIDQGPVIRNSATYQHGLLGARQEVFFARMKDVLSCVEAIDSGALRSPVNYDVLPEAVQSELIDIFSTFSLAAFGKAPLRNAIRPLLRLSPLVRRLMPGEALGTYLHIMRAYLEQDYDLRPVFRGISVPMTVVIGGASRMYPAAGQRTIAALVPHAVMREIGGAGHVVPLEAPIQFVRELSAFLETPARA